jgi:hypothetical protein
MTKIRTSIQLLAAAYLFSASLRGPRDYRIAGKVIVAAACIKAGMAVWVRFTLPSAFPSSEGVMTEMEYATSHGDSLLFACAIVVLVGPLLYQPRARQLRWMLLTLPLIVAGLFANDRRIAWVQIALGLVVLVGMNLRQVLTRRLVRTGVLVSPVILAYVLAGWWLPSRVFGPVHLSETRGGHAHRRQPDRSTRTVTAKTTISVIIFAHPPMGTGFGHPPGKGHSWTISPRTSLSLPTCRTTRSLACGPSPELRASRASSRHSSSRCSWPRARTPRRSRPLTPSPPPGPSPASAPMCSTCGATSGSPNLTLFSWSV